MMVNDDDDVDGDDDVMMIDNGNTCRKWMVYKGRWLILYNGYSMVNDDLMMVYNGNTWGFHKEGYPQ